ncbi:hypothetical protein VTO42DRAFT_3228 [Malbranchea cinnamomea]
MKRKQSGDLSDDDPLQREELTPRKRRAPITPRSKPHGTNSTGVQDSPAETPSMRLRSRSKLQSAAAKESSNVPVHSPIPQLKSKVLFETPTKTSGLRNETPSRKKAAADRSAKRKSARILLSPTEDDIWDGGQRLAQEILGLDDNGDAGAVSDGADGADDEAAPVSSRANDVDATPRRGRPKGSKSRRSPTPEGDLPPHEKYFFQNRPGTVQTSNNTLRKLSLLTHEEYFEQLGKYVDPHAEEKEYLLELHQRSFPQWHFELSESFNVCLYGYGSKRELVFRFADWLYEQHPEPTIVVVNGYAPNITMRSIITTISEAALGSDAPSKLGTQPTEMLDSLQSALNANPPSRPILLLVHSIDALPLRRQSHQSFLARLASLPHVNLLATADMPNFTLLWDVSLRDKFNFIFHDCTTFAPYDVELDVVDEVHSLFGRKTRRVGGKQGIGFVLKSLPENTRKLYRLLITEILTLLGDQHSSDDDDDAEEHKGRAEASKRRQNATIEWRTLFNKAAEEFISSSEMMFRAQLKEFYDHQMIISRTDPSGAEMLGVPLSREEMEGVLEDLVLDQ